MELVNSAAFSGVCYFLASVFVITGFLTLWSFRLLPGSITSLTRQRSIHICAILVAICTLFLRGPLEFLLEYEIYVLTQFILNALFQM